MTAPRPWVWFIVAGAVFLAVLTAWFVIAAEHPVAEVPLVSTHRSP